MISRSFTVALCRAIHASRQAAFLFVVWLEGELIIRLADAPTGAGILGLVVAVGLRATGCRMRPVADRLLAQMLVLFAGIWTGCSLAAGIFWRRYLRWWLTRIAIVRTLLTVALIFVTVTPGAPALGGPAAFAAGPAHDLVRSEAKVRTVHDLGAERRWGLGSRPFPHGGDHRRRSAWCGRRFKSGRGSKRAISADPSRRI